MSQKKIDRLEIRIEHLERVIQAYGFADTAYYRETTLSATLEKELATRCTQPKQNLMEWAALRKKVLS